MASRGAHLPLYATIAADVISRAGNALTAIAIPWFVLVTTGSAARTGVVVFAGAVPVVISLLFGGTIVDRFPYRRVSIVSDIASGISVGLIPLLHYTVGITFWQLVVLVFFGALLDLPAALARIASLPDLARLAGMRFERVNALSEGAMTVIALVVPALGGVLIAVVGPSNVLWIDAATFAISALIMLVLVPDVTRSGAGLAGGYLSELRRGLRFVRREPVLFPLILFFAAMNIVIGPIDTVIVPVFANEVYNSAVAFGFMAAASGAGALLGTAVFGAIGHRLSRRGVFFGGFLAVPLALGVLAVSPSLPVTLAVLALLGLGLGLTNLLEYTIYFERIPAAMRARVLGITGAIGWSSVPVGRLTGGYLLEYLGLATTLVLLALIVIPVPFLMFVVRAFRNLGAPSTAGDGDTESRLSAAHQLPD